jgi:DNA-binding transcriptional LysR family regulator
MRSRQKDENNSTNLEYYKVFYHVATCGSVTKAAHKLSVSQPAVSQQIKQLEECLGVKLFERSARGVHLTEEGSMLFGYIKRGYEEIQMGERKLRQMMHLDIGEIRIGASDMTLRFFLLPYLQKFHEAYDGVQVRVNNAPTPETLELLQQGTIDFGVISGPLSSHLAGVDTIPVRKTQDVFIAGSKYRNLQGQTLPLKKLRELPLIFLEDDTSTRRAVDSFLSSHKIQVKPEFELATSDMIVEFAERNLGIGCVTRDFAQDAIDRGTVFELTFDTPIPEREFYVATYQDKAIPYSAQRLLEMIREGVGIKEDKEEDEKKA